MFSLFEIVGRALTSPIEIIDVGAMAIPGLTPSHERMVRAAGPGRCRVVGFEPVQAECDKLNAQARRDHLYLPHFIGDGSDRTFRLCNSAATSSLYEPNTPLLEKFNAIEEFSRVVERARVQTRRLDDIPEIKRIDFMKVDVQGAERDVLVGAPRLMRDALVIECEVEFVEMYQGQPLFADVDVVMRRAGMAFHCFPGLAGRAFRPLILDGDPTKQLNQVLWGDAVYVRDFMTWDHLPVESLLRIATILHDLYESLDMALLALSKADEAGRTSFAKVYMDRLIAAKSQGSSSRR